MLDKCLVNCSSFSGDFRNIHDVIFSFRCPEYKEGMFEVMSDRLMSREVMLFTLSALISSMLISNVVSSSNFVPSILLFTIIGSNFLSKDAGILERYFSCTMDFDEILNDGSFSTSVDYDRYSVSLLIGNSFF